MPPENMAIDMRRTKLKAEEAALLAGELKKPSWQSKNEGIHERVSFEDAIWGFDLAGGAYYKTPLRVVGVKSGSRAEKAGIRPGDKLKRINDIDTSTLTIQEAHEIIIASGVHLKIAVTAPEDEEDAYFCYEDPIESGYDSEEERRKQEELERKRRVHAKVRSDWSLQWPWVSKRKIIYRESNCFMVPSKYESKHRDKFPLQPVLRQEDDVILQNVGNVISSKTETSKTEKTNEPLTNGKPDLGMSNGNQGTDIEETRDEPPMLNGHSPTPNANLKNTDPVIENGTDSVSMDPENQTLDSEIEHSEVETTDDLSQDFENLVNENDENVGTTEDISQNEEMNDNTDEIINEVYENTESLSKDDEEHILNSVLSEVDHIQGSIGSVDER